MKRIYYVMMALLFCAVSINAQVRIGNNTEPHKGAVLDLQSTETAGKGLLLPQVELTSLTVFAPVAGTATEGMLVYNIGNAVDKGLYVWDGSSWSKVSSGNDGGDNGDGTVTSDCGAWLDEAKTEWLTFMCHNLGADEMANPFLYSDATLGDLYQWGRKADAHEKRTSTSVSGPITSANLDGNGQVASGQPQYGKFITSGTSPYDWRTPQDTQLWGAEKTVDDPCPAGWKVPTSAQWTAIRSANTWTWTNSGYTVGDALYLPAAGRRHYGGTLVNMETHGHYWSSTASSGQSQYLYFTSTNISPASTNSNSYRATGMTVRCVADN